eukprot:scpid105442/ scgid15058/ 
MFSVVVSVPRRHSLEQGDDTERIAEWLRNEAGSKHTHAHARARDCILVIAHCRKLVTWVFLGGIHTHTLVSSLSGALVFISRYGVRLLNHVLICVRSCNCAFLQIEKIEWM